jgi:hypothetical protein
MVAAVEEVAVESGTVAVGVRFMTTETDTGGHFGPVLKRGVSEIETTVNEITDTWTLTYAREILGMTAMLETVRRDRNLREHPTNHRLQPRTCRHHL